MCLYLFVTFTVLKKIGLMLELSRFARAPVFNRHQLGSYKHTRGPTIFTFNDRNTFRSHHEVKLLIIPQHALLLNLLHPRVTQGWGYALRCHPVTRLLTNCNGQIARDPSREKNILGTSTCTRASSFSSMPRKKIVGPRLVFVMTNSFT
jgi:hypothetical protein